MVIYERPSQFPLRGVPWASEKVLPGLDDLGRKRVQRALDHLVGRGLVRAFDPHGSKTFGVALTEAGDHYARSLAGLPVLADAIPVLEQLVEAVKNDDRACEFLNRVWMPETAFAGVQWGDNELKKCFVDLEERFLPAHVAPLQPERLPLRPPRGAYLFVRWIRWAATMLRCRSPRVGASVTSPVCRSDAR